MKIIGFKGTLKVFYYLMAVDEVTDFELERFDEIGQELMGSRFLSVRDEIISLCKSTLSAIETEDERFDIIQEAIDDALKNETYDIRFGVAPRMLVWDMLSLAYSDGEYTEQENRLIGHVSRILEIEKSVLVEMKQLMSTAQSVVAQQEELEKSERPYSEVKPLIDEIENRKATILQAVTALIEDDILLDYVEPEEEKESAVKSAAKKFGERVSPVAKNLAQKTQNGFKNGSGKLKDKVKKFSKKPPFVIPSKYEKANDEIKTEAGFPVDNDIYCAFNDDTYAFIQFKTSLSDEPYDYDEQSLIDLIHDSIKENDDDLTGIVEISGGTTKSGGKYIIQILKQSAIDDNGNHTGNQYLLDLYIQKDGEDQLVEGNFVEVGTTGLRDTVILDKMMREGKVSDDFPNGWAMDPYDPEFKKGFLMNLSEREEYDKLFPSHPLSEARRFAKFVVGSN